MNQSAPTSPHAAADVVDYIVLVSNEDDYHASYHQFAEKVKARLKAGYQLHGSPFTVKQSLCQAMIRLATTKHNGDTLTHHKSHAAHH